MLTIFGTIYNLKHPKVLIGNIENNNHPENGLY